MSEVTIRHIDDLKNNKTPLTVVDGVGEATAKKLRNGGITTVMALSACNPVKLIALGVQQGSAVKIVDAAQALVDQFQQPTSVTTPSLTEEQAIESTGDQSETQFGTITINGQDVQITSDDVERAELIGVPIEDYMFMHPDTKAQEYRIAASLIVQKDAPLVDHEAFDLDNLDPMAAPEFIRKRQKYELKATRERHINRHKTFEQTASFVQDTVFGEDIDGTGSNVNPVAAKATKTKENPTKEDLETEVYIPNRKKRESRLEAKKAQENSVKMVLDEMLSQGE